MTLQSWLQKHSITLSDFARRIGVANASVVQRYVNGRVPQSKEVMAAIVRETGGEVTANDFFAVAAE